MSKECRWIENGLRKVGNRPENMGNGLFRAAIRCRSRISFFFRNLLRKAGRGCGHPADQGAPGSFDYWAGLEDRNDPHLFSAIGTAERIDLVYLLKSPVVHEIDPETFGYAKNPVPARNLLEDLRQNRRSPNIDKSRPLYKVARTRIGASTGRPKRFPVPRNDFPRICGTGCPLGFEACRPRPAF